MTLPRTFQARSAWASRAVDAAAALRRTLALQRDLAPRWARAPEGESPPAPHPSGWSFGLGAGRRCPSALVPELLGNP